MEEGRTNGNELKTELKRIRTQIIRLQKKWLGRKDKIAFAHYRISDLEQIIKKIQAHHQTDQKMLGLSLTAQDSNKLLGIVIAFILTKGCVDKCDLLLGLLLMEALSGGSAIGIEKPI
ncbi:hypothetical protein Tco_0493390 [Tanacetum coccineum]